MDDQDDEARMESEALATLRAIANDPQSPATAKVAAAKAVLTHMREREAQRRVADNNAALDDLLKPLPLCGHRSLSDA